MSYDAEFKGLVIYLGFAILWQIKGWEKRLSAQIYAIHRLENRELYRDEETPEFRRAVAEVEAHEKRWDRYGHAVLLGALSIGASLYFYFR